MPAQLTLGKTKLEYGYFYTLHPNRWGDPGDDWIISDDPKAYPYSKCEVVGSALKEVQRFKCSANPQHGRTKEPFDYLLDVTYIGKPYPSIIPNSDHVVITDWLVDRLRTSGLKGWRGLPCQLRDNPEWFKDEKTTPLPKLFQLAFDGLVPQMRPHIEPAAEDKCPYCGRGPLVCPSCGTFPDPCLNCGKEWSVPVKRHGGAADTRIIFDAERLYLLDIRYWDGSDFMGVSYGGCITRRALDWLLSIHAAPFRAEPAAVNVAGLSKAELARLEEVRKPLPNVTPPALEKFTKKPRK